LYLAIGTAAFAADTGNRAPAKPHREVQPNVPIGRQAGDTIASALLISALPFSDVGTTSGFSNDYDATCPYGGGTAPDVVYVIAPDTTIYVDIDLCGSAYDTKLYIFDTDLNIVACNDDYYYDSECGILVSRLVQVAMMAGGDFSSSSTETAPSTARTIYPSRYTNHVSSPAPWARIWNPNPRWRTNT